MKQPKFKKGDKISYLKNPIDSDERTIITLPKDLRIESNLCGFIYIFSNETMGLLEDEMEAVDEANS